MRRVDENTMEANVRGAEFDIRQFDVFLDIDLGGHAPQVVFGALGRGDPDAHAFEVPSAPG